MISSELRSLVLSPTAGGTAKLEVRLLDADGKPPTDLAGGVAACSIYQELPAGNKLVLEQLSVMLVTTTATAVIQLSAAETRALLVNDVAYTDCIADIRVDTSQAIHYFATLRFKVRRAFTLMGGNILPPPPHSSTIYAWAAAANTTPAAIPVDAVATATGTVTLADFTDDSYIIIAQVSALADITSITEGGIDQFSAYEKGAATFMDGGEEYEYWVSVMQQLGGAGSGGTLSLG